MGRSWGRTPRSGGGALVRLVRFLVVSDPGQLRLRSASQTTSTLVVALVCLVVTTRALGQPITVAMLGSVVAMFSAFVVRDRSARGRLLTTGLIIVPAAIAVTVSTLLGPIRVAADVGFIVVLFTAVYVRRFGPRGFALGMGAFISYFFALFLRAQPAQLPYLLMAIAIGVGAALTVRYLFQREWAGAELTRLTRALRASALDVVDTIDPLGAEGYAPPVPGRHEAGARRTVAERLERLANTALMIEDWLDRNVAAAHVSVTGNDLSRRIFDAQQATEQVAFAMRGADPAHLSTTVRRVFAALRVVLHTTPTDDELRSARRIVTRAEAGATGSDQESIVVRSVARAVRAHTAVHRVAAHAIEREAAGERSSSPEPPPVVAVESEDSTVVAQGWFARLEPTTRTAIQVAVATSIATVLGELVSPARWYWAVLSAFVVFTGTTTRGEILTRAGHRIVGTVVGVLAGVLLAALVGHNPPVQLALIVVCVFFAFYLVAVANGLLVFFITVLLAMLYGLLGTFSVAVLELRIVETCVGASVGIVAAYFILPTRTRETVREKVDDYLEALDDLIVQCVDSVVEPGRDVDLVPAARRLDLALQALQTAARPLQVGASDRRSLRVAPASRARRSTARLVRVLEACDRAAHALTRAGIVAAGADPATAPSPEIRDALRSGTDDVRASVAALRSVVRESGGRADEDFEDARSHSLGQTPVTALVERDPEQLPTATRIAVRALDRLDHAAGLTRVPI